MNRPLNVLQFTCPNGFYGAERWIIALAKNLDPDSINCSLVITREPGSGNEEVARHFRNLGKTVHEIPMVGRFDVRVIPQLCRLIKKENIDIIHTHGYKSDILGLIAARLSGIKAVSTPHGFVNVENWKLRLYYSLGNRFFKWFDIVAPLSQQLCKDVEELGVKPSKIQYIQNGVDVDEIEESKGEQRSDIQKPSGVKRIGFIGQITKRKNVGEILKIYEKICLRHDNLELIFLGDGELLEEYRKTAETMANSNTIQFLGFQTDRLSWLGTFDLFVMTSSLEGIPRCMMEAMTMGVPVAAYKIPGIDQLIQHNKTGLLAEYGNSKVLEEYWEKLLFNEDFSSQITASARRFILENFSAHRMAQEYTKLFFDMVAAETEYAVNKP